MLGLTLAATTAQALPSLPFETLLDGPSTSSAAASGPASTFIDNDYDTYISIVNALSDMSSEDGDMKQAIMASIETQR